MSLLKLCAWLQATPVGVLVRESLWVFPTLVAIHILGLAASVGLVVWFDLRLLDAHMRESSAARVYGQIMPWALGGFVVMWVSGALLVSGFATAAYGNVYFRVKVAALALAGLNALLYHCVTARRMAQQHGRVSKPPSARLAGLISIVLWVVVIMAGRMLSYTLYSH